MDESQVNDRAESPHRHRRELYRMQMDRETPEEAELRRGNATDVPDKKEQENKDATGSILIT